MPHRPVVLLTASLPLKVPLVVEHDRSIGSALAVGEARALVERAGGDVRFARIELDARGTARFRVVHRRLKQRAPEAEAAPIGRDVELFEVGIEHSCIERRTEAKLGESVWPVAGEEDDDLAAFDQGRGPFGDRVSIRLRR